MARGIFSKTTAAITTNATTNVIPAPAADETVYVSFLCVDVSVAGSTWIGTFQPTATTTAFKRVFSLNAVGTLESYMSPSQSVGARYPGFALPKGEGLDCVTSGTTPGSFTASAIYETK